MSWVSDVVTTATRAAVRLRPAAIACHAHRLLYYPVPKAGSSTIKTLIAQADALAVPGRPQDAEFELVPASRAGDYPEYRTLTAVRDPWSRIASCYRQKIADPRERGAPLFSGFARYNRIFHRRVFWLDMSLAQFVATVATIPDPLADEHFRSQVRQLPASRRRLRVDYLLRVDDPSSFAAELSSIFGVPVPAVNSTRAGPAGSCDPFTPETRRLVARRYRADIALLGYDRPRD